MRFLFFSRLGWTIRAAMDGKHVVFGKVIGGLEVLKAMEATGSPSGKPSKGVVVANCGVL